jgi:hypothetical protein
MHVHGLVCCGVRELARISTENSPAEVIKTLVSTHDLQTGAFVFTEAGAKSRYATNLAAYIKANNLGEVDTIPPFVNRNTRRKIRMFVWRFDYNALQDWVKSTLNSEVA